MNGWLLNSSPVVWSVRIQAVHVGPLHLWFQSKWSRKFLLQNCVEARAERGSVLMCEVWVVQKAKQLSDIQEVEEEDTVKDLLSDENHHNVFFRGIFICWLWKAFFATVVSHFEELVPQEWGNGVALAVQYHNKGLAPVWLWQDLLSWRTLSTTL